MRDDLLQILGIRFFVGEMTGLLERTFAGGLIVAPAAPALVDLPDDPAYREALEESDFAITDSGFMVLLWLLLKGRRIPRISGLRFIRALLARKEFREPGATYWVMPSAEDARTICAWLQERGVPAGPEECWCAPRYDKGRLEDPELLARIESLRPRFVVINIGGGTQERLGLYLRKRLSYDPAIICTGAAVAFLAGRDVGIPVWADRTMLGWLFRCFYHPRRFIPRIAKGLRLIPLLLKHGTHTAAPPAK